MDDTGFVWTWKILQESLLMPSTITLLFQARGLGTSWVWELIPVSIYLEVLLKFFFLVGWGRGFIIFFGVIKATFQDCIININTSTQTNKRYARYNFVLDMNISVQIIIYSVHFVDLAKTFRGDSAHVRAFNRKGGFLVSQLVCIFRLERILLLWVLTFLSRNVKQLSKAYDWLKYI